jgi:LmbE family N-acetylglucosaminyl deacetylase
MKRLLISFAHPDDETFGLGGLIARYASEDVEVNLICATNGDAGTVSPEMLEGYCSVADLRLAELECAVQKLGVSRVFRFDYKDSGMMGDITNQDPACLWYNWQHKPDEVTGRIVKVIREVRPQVVITFNEYGGYGHPDHIAMQRATRDAFFLAGDAAYECDGLAPYKPQKLYYSRFPTLALRFDVLIMRLTGKDPKRAGRNQDIDLLAILEHVQPEHTSITVGKYRKVWRDANVCHASQLQGALQGNHLTRAIRWWQSRKQSLTRIYPVPDREMDDQHDLFGGTDLAETASHR